MKKWFAYILTNKRNGTLYVGVTSDLEKRIAQHKKWEHAWFTKKFTLHSLVWYQDFSTIQEAIQMEKKLKWKSRTYKIQLTEEKNLHWFDLAENR